MTLRQKQSLFVICICELIKFAYSKGYELTFGDAHRSIIEATRLGKRNSVHTLRLAVDFNLFKDGRFQDTTEAHRELGEFWETLHPLCRWGGRFNDGNHYSFEHNGVK